MPDEHTATAITEGGGGIRVALVHSFYDDSSPSGENLVVENQLRALQNAGHDVELFEVRTSERQSEPLYRTRSAFRVASGFGRRPTGISEFVPDIVHLHNLFPNFGRRWVKDLGIPVVATLHNYRPLCANGFLLRDDRVCTLCPDGAPMSSLRFACYRGSRLATAPLTAATWDGGERDPVLTAADRILVLSGSMAQIYERAGVSRDRLSVMPNFLSDELRPDRRTSVPVTDDWLFVGRLSPEKGILDLVRSWPSDRALKVVGDGPQRDAVQAASEGKPIEILGPLDRTRILGLMQRSIGLVFPSKWLEGAALVYIEALASGLPVLAWDPNVLAELVEEEGTGHAVTWTSDLGEALNHAASTFSGLREKCVAMFEADYSERAFIDRTERIYSEVARQ